MIEFLLSLNTISFFAAILGVLAVFLTARQKILCWPIGILNTILSGYVYFVQQLPAEALLQVVYLIMAIYGWIIWGKNSSKTSSINFGWASTKTNISLIVFSIILGIFLGYSIYQITNSLTAYLDATLTSFSLSANYLTARKKIDNWIYWLAINAVSVLLYEYKSMHWFAFLFVFYFIIALRGLTEWKRSLQTQ